MNPLRKGMDNLSTRATKKVRRENPVSLLKYKLDRCSKDGNLKEALDLYDYARREGIKLGVQHYNSLLYLCSSRSSATAGDGVDTECDTELGLKRGVEILEQMQMDRVDPNEATFTNAARLCCRSDDPEMAFSLVKQMQGFGIPPKLSVRAAASGCVATVRQVSESTARAIEEWFQSKAAAEVGDRNWDAEKIKEGVSREEVDGMDKGAAVCFPEEAKNDFNRFQEWLKEHGPFDAVVDGANLNIIVNKLREISPTKKLPLVILHTSRVHGGAAKIPYNKQLLDNWKRAGALYAILRGSNDDWYWLYAAVSSKCLLVTNDVMRDHLFQLLGNSLFPVWKEKHQESEQGSWHVPTVTGDDIEAPRQWGRPGKGLPDLPNEARVKAVQSRPSWASLGRGDLRKGYLIAQRGQSESHSEWADEDVGLQRVGQCYNPTLASSSLGLMCLASFMSDQLACEKYGRKDLSYQNWRWQPHHCDMPRFNGPALLERLRNKRMVFVGDSLNRGQWVSMVCLVERSIPSHLKKMDTNGSLITFRAIEYNATVEFYWAPLLVESNSDDPINHNLPERIVRIQAIEKHARHWTNAHIIVFDTYLWWLIPKMKVLWGSFENPDAGIYKDVEMTRAYELALQTWADWLELHINKSLTSLFFVSMSPTHQRGEEWGGRAGQNCFNETSPVAKAKYWGTGSETKLMRIVENTISSLKHRGINIQMLNITQLSEYRKEAHPSIYRKQWEPLSKDQLSDPSSYADCIHWCLPGVPDTWNEILYTYIVQSVLKSSQN
ncbi:unnamed protein product [Rhodiola kirilowii]